ncbi:MAG: hypothetical protein WA783_01080 [Phormidesmis sp.]
MFSSASFSAFRRNRATKLALAGALAAALVLATAPASHALLLDPAREALASDLAASGFEGASGIELFFGFLEFILIAIPIGTGAMALSQMNRGSEAWLPWFTVMGGSIVFIAFVTVLIGRVYA